jgi:hypothetical protein
MTIENFTTDIAEMDVEEMAEEFYTKFGNTSFAEELANGTFDMTFEEDLENFKECCEWLEQYAAEETAFAAAEQAREKYEDMDPTTYSDIFDEPSTFEEAWNHPEPFQRKKWREAIDKEFKSMEELEVWTKIPRAKMPSGRRCVKHKWVYTIKRCGKFRARLVACGYSQVPGLDFQETVHCHVANDVTFRLLLISLILNKHYVLIFDVSCAFLHGTLVEDLYMDCPKGMKARADECLLLNKSIYGLVQGSKQWYKAYKAIMVGKMGFEECPCDPCLFKKEDHNGICYVVCYVDDNLCIGDEAAVKATIEEIQKHGLKITITDNLDDYLSCEVKLNKKGDTAWIGQPHMVKKVLKSFEDEIKGLKTLQTPGTPGQGLILEKDAEEIVDKDKHSRYRTGVGSVLYLIKHSRPDIANAVRELSKCLSAPNGSAYKEMLRVIKYVADTKDTGLRMKPEKSSEWTVEVYTDSDWAGDKDTRKSVSGFMIFVCDTLVCWRSKSQNALSLSSSEAEMYALTEAIKEVPFIIQVLLFMGVKIKLPAQVKCDNMGAICISENAAPSARTRHADLRQKFTADLQDKGLIKVDFVKSEDNTADILTKNVSIDLFKHHTRSIVMSKNDLENGDAISSVRKGVEGVTSLMDNTGHNKHKEAHHVSWSHAPTENIKNTENNVPHKRNIVPQDENYSENKKNNIPHEENIVLHDKRYVPQNKKNRKNHVPQNNGTNEN